MTAPRRPITDLRDESTLAISLSVAFSSVAPAYGVRLAGIEDDINEHTDFWLQVARSLLEANP